MTSWTGSRPRWLLAPLAPLALLALLATGVGAQEATANDEDLLERLKPAVGLTLGTTGIGVEASVRPMPQLGFRLGLATIPYSYDFDEDEVTGKAEPPSPIQRLSVDYAPLGGAFHLTAGFHRVSNGVRGSAVATDSIEFNDRDYAPQDVGRIEAEVWGRSIAPYLGFGWQGTGGRFQVYGDLGVILTGSPGVDIRVSGVISDDPQFQQDLEAERREIEDDLKSLWGIPHIALGLRYRIGGGP